MPGSELRKHFSTCYLLFDPQKKKTCGGHYYPHFTYGKQRGGVTEFSGLPQLVKRTDIRSQVLRSCPHSQLRGREVEAEIHPFHKEGNEFRQMKSCVFLATNKHLSWGRAGQKHSSFRTGNPRLSPQSPGPWQCAGT